MITKKKICSVCNTEQFIWKNHEKQRFCKFCWSTHNSKDIKKPNKIGVSRVSDKRKKETVEYLKLRLEYLNNHKFCEAKLNGCTHYSTEIHHKVGGSNRSKSYLDVNIFMAICRTCHTSIHNSPKEARELGYLI